MSNEPLRLGIVCLDCCVGGGPPDLVVFGGGGTRVAVAIPPAEVTLMESSTSVTVNEQSSPFEKHVKRTPPASRDSPAGTLMVPSRLFANQSASLFPKGISTICGVSSGSFGGGRLDSVIHPRRNRRAQTSTPLPAWLPQSAGRLKSQPLGIKHV